MYAQLRHKICLKQQIKLKKKTTDLFINAIALAYIPNFPKYSN